MTNGPPDWDAIAARSRVPPQDFAALKADFEALKADATATKAALVKQGTVTEAAIDAELSPAEAVKGKT